jgi:hypothetical protein
MLNKIITTLSAVVIIGSATAAFAGEVPEHKLGDRYPFLEQTYRPIAAAPQARRHVANTGLYANQAPENKIGDRYPWLEAPATVTASTAARVVRTARPVTYADRALFDRQSMRSVF